MTRDNNYNRFKSCLKSKAQIISTDYYMQILGLEIFALNFQTIIIKVHIF